jgi:hypothetical protein
VEVVMMPDTSHDEEWYRMAVEFLADRAGVPLAQVYREALDALIKAKGLDWKEVEDWALRKGRQR